MLEHTATSEEALLEEGLSTDELRAIRLLSRASSSRSHASYLAHVEQIASAEGPGAATARTVKRADLGDRVRIRRPAPTDGRRRTRSASGSSNAPLVSAGPVEDHP